MEPTITLDTLAAAAEETAQPRYPYDRRNMTHEVEVPLDSDPTQLVTRTRKVTEDFEVALANPEYDYWHPGGEIIGKSGQRYGEHVADWYIKGHKWQRGKPGHN